MRRERTHARWVVLMVLASAAAGVWIGIKCEKGPAYEGKSASAWLEVLVRGPDDSKAAQAFKELGEAATPVLEQALRARDSRIKRVLMKWDASIPLVDFEWMEDKQRRLAALSAVRALGPPGSSLLPALMDAFTDGTMALPETAFREAFLAVGTNSVVAFVRRMAQGDVGYDREKLMLEVWGELGVYSADSLDILICRLGRTDAGGVSDSISTLAARVLAGGGVRAAPAVDALLEVIELEDWSARAAAVAAVGKIGVRLDEVIPAVAARLVDEQWQVRLVAAQTLGHLGPSARTAANELAEAINDPVPSVAVAVLNALRAVGPTGAAADPAVAALRSSSRLVRLSATRVLARLPSAAALAVPSLAEAIDDEDVDVRVAAARALSQFGPRAMPALSTLVSALPRNPEPVQLCIIEALGEMGSLARPAVEAIRLAWSNNQSAMKRMAIPALAKIEAAGEGEEPVP